MKLLNSTTYEGKEFTINDVRGFIPKGDKNLPEGYYGGRVTQLAKTETPGVYLCMENMSFIDILIFEDELENDPLYKLTNKELIKMLEDKGIEVPAKANKAQLVELIKENKEV